MKSPSLAYILLENSTFRGPDGPIFPNLNLTIEPGQRWAVLGPSGSGKGCLLSGLMGKLRLLTGRLRHPFLENDPRYVDSIYGVLPMGTMALASMSQHHQLLLAREFHQLRWHGSLSMGTATVRAFLERHQVFAHTPYAILPTSDQARFEFVQQREISRFELQPLLDRPLVGLSNGELHRLLLAQALLHDPRFLLIDEPFDGLDAHSRTSLVDILDQLAKEGIGVMLSTSRSTELPSDISHLILVKDGNIQQVGSRSKVIFPTPKAQNQPAFSFPTWKPIPLSSDTPLVDFHRVTIRQGSITLLDEISFQIFSGEQWALLGPNGSGKSTLLSLILADNPQVYANHVAVAGKQLGPGYSIWDRKALLGWVSPELDVHFSPNCTTLEVVLSGFANSLGSYRVYSANEIQSAHACLNGLGLGAIQNHPLTKLSPVERRLVLLARAAVHRPYLLLLDEPCQGLDPPGSQRLLSAIESIINALSASMIFVTHKISEIPARVDHLLLLDQGHITYAGSRANYTQALPGY